MNLRPYQQQAFDSITSGWAECQRQLAVIATGGGKTILFSHLAAAETVGTAEKLRETSDKTGSRRRRLYPILTQPNTP